MIKDPYGNGRFFGMYRGVVVSNSDPQGKGRLKLKVPQVLLDEVTGWADPVTQPGVLRTTPAVGEGVFVVFEGGDPSFPIWTGTFVPPLISFGSFYDTTTQTASSTTVAYPMGLNTIDQASQVTITDGSKITIAVPGTYNLQWSGQFQNTDSSAHDVRVWLRYNGVDYPQSGGLLTVPSKHGSVNGHVIAAWNYVGTSQAPGDYVQIMWSTASTSVSLAAYSGGTSPTSPAVPSLIVTLTQVK